MQSKKTAIGIGAAIGYVIFMLLLTLPIAAALVSLFYVPEQVAVHFNGDWEADGYGSKYLLLVVPIINLLFGIFFFVAWKKFFDKKYELILLIGADAGMLCFNGINCSLLSNALSSVDGENPTWKVALIALGICAIVAVLTVVIAKIIGKRRSIKRQNKTI